MMLKSSILNILSNRINKVIVFRICFILALITAFVFGFKLNVINDGFWHIKVGEYIIKNRIIPHRDIFSWYGIQNKLEWISHEWLFGIIAYLIYKIKGFASVIIFLVIINLITCIILYKFALIRNKNKVISLIIMWVYIFANANDIFYRPLLISKFLLLIIFILLENKKYIAALFTLILGINIHGGVYPLYLIVFAYYTIPKNYKYFIAALIGIFINPYGYKLYEYTYLAMRNSDINRYINEWVITPLYAYKLALIVICITVCVLAVCKVKFRDFLICGALIILAISAKRHMFVICIFVFPIISTYVIDFYHDFFDKFFEKSLTAKVKNLETKLNYITCAILISVLCMKSIFDAGSYLLYVNVQNLTKVVYNVDCPVKVCDYINTHEEIKNSRIFNDYNSSPYLIFRGVKTFVDTREDLFTYNFNRTNAFVDQIKALNDYNYMIYVFKKYKIQYAILRDDMNNTKLLRDNDWTYKIYDDNTYSIFEINSYK
ncbi:hypothetical protein [Clostridium felsineum]|uniref:hypothetical protein n=1 Tax=Clostridium felsineum TaxID=36839 RepID=UPI00214D8AD1|nr:hypothetical protein [Clostridium felsineum]